MGTGSHSLIVCLCPDGTNRRQTSVTTVSLDGLSNTASDKSLGNRGGICDHNLAYQCFRLTLASNNDHAEAYNNLGVLELKRGHVEAEFLLISERRPAGHRPTLGSVGTRTYEPTKSVAVRSFNKIAIAQSAAKIYLPSALSLNRISTANCTTHILPSDQPGSSSEVCMASVLLSYSCRN
ncbi:hypothetical protein BaRGS_00035064 [Batillaria attramentaria]|uniref:Uncharacterized protein n=1 Tax=Batillaria attramentaria TaxID=370345 RepID=A0ABD0JFL9_9CAEN